MNKPLHSIGNRVARFFNRGNDNPASGALEQPALALNTGKTNRRLELLLPFYWPGQAATIHWCVTVDGKPEAQGKVDSLQELDDDYRQLPLWVYVDSGDVSILHATLPNASRKHLAKAIPYALEDRLLGDIEEQFFTWTKDSDSTLSVSVIAHDRMRDIIDALEKEGWFPASMSPVTLTAPMLENCWTLVCSENSGWLRTGTVSGMHCAELINNPPYALVKLLADARETDSAPTGLLVINPPDSLDASKWAVELGLEIFLPEGDLWENLDRGKPPIELLHDPYASKAKHQTSPRYRLSFIILAAILVIGNGAAFGWNWFQVYRESSKLHEKMTAIFVQAFPDQANTVYDPVVQMQRNLDRLRQERGGAGPGDFLTLLSPVSKSLSSLSIDGLDSIQYRNDEIILQVGVADYEKLDSLVAALKAQDLVAEVKEASSDAKGAQAKVSVRRAVGTNS